MSTDSEESPNVESSRYGCDSENRLKAGPAFEDEIGSDTYIVKRIAEALASDPPSWARLIVPKGFFDLSDASDGRGLCKSYINFFFSSQNSTLLCNAYFLCHEGSVGAGEIFLIQKNDKSKRLKQVMFTSRFSVGSLRKLIDNVRDILSVELEVEDITENY